MSLIALVQEGQDSSIGKSQDLGSMDLRSEPLGCFGDVGL